MSDPRDAYRRFTRRGGGKPVTSAHELDRLFALGLSEVVRRLQLRTFQVLTSATPVDKGTARSGWTPSVGSPILDPVRAPKEDDAARAAAAQRFAENQTKARAIAGSYLVEQGPAFIANAVPWIIPLNAGSSSQAPAMFVERGIETALRSIDQAA